MWQFQPRSAKRERLITGHLLQGKPPGKGRHRQHADENCEVANGVMQHPTRVPSSMTGFQHGLKTSKAIFADRELKVFEPQKGEAI